MIRLAIAGPILGRASSSAAVARLMLMGKEDWSGLGLGGWGLVGFLVVFLAVLLVVFLGD